MVHPHRLQ